MYIKLLPCNMVHLSGEVVYVEFNEKTYICTDIEKELTLIAAKCMNIQEVNKRFENIDYLDVISNIPFIEISNKKEKESKLTGKSCFYYPYSIQISLTNRCVHMCNHCFKNCSANGKDINLQAVNNLLDILVDKTEMIELTGGEPFLNRDVIKIVEKYENKFDFTVTTSGYNLNTFDIQFLKKFKLIQISLNGINDSQHDSFVHCQGSFAKVTKNIKWLTSYGINVLLTTTINKPDLVYMEKFVQMCINLNIKKTQIGLIIPIGRAKNMGCYNFNDIEDEYIQILSFLKDKYMNQIEIFMDDEKKLNLGNEKKCFQCDAGVLKWYIDENEIIYPCTYCQVKEFEIGKLNDNDIYKLIVDNKFEEYDKFFYENRDRIKESLNKNEIDVNQLCTEINI